MCPTKVIPELLKFLPKTFVGMLGSSSIFCWILKSVGSKPGEVEYGGGEDIFPPKWDNLPENEAYTEICGAEAWERNGTMIIFLRYWSSCISGFLALLVNNFLACLYTSSWSLWVWSLSSKKNPVEDTHAPLSKASGYKYNFSLYGIHSANPPNANFHETESKSRNQEKESLFSLSALDKIQISPTCRRPLFFSF